MSEKARGRDAERAHILILAMALVLVVVVMSFLSPHFLSVRNFLNATRFMAEIGLLSLGMALVVIAGGIDLSVGSVMALCAVAMGLFFAAGVPPLPAALTVLVLGAACGGLNGLIVTRLRIPPIIATLATLAIFRGVALGISGGGAYAVGDGFALLGQGFVLGLPVQFVVFVIVALTLWAVLRYSTFGRSLYAVGANETAARFSGLRVERTKIIAYVLSGILASAAALVFVSRVSSAKANVGMGYELDAITIVVLAGIPITGGRGSVGAVMLALVTIGFVRNGMTLAFIQADIQAVLIGALLLFAVLINRLLELFPTGSRLPFYPQVESESLTSPTKPREIASANSGRTPTE
jgi:rhamnose transport system permease protein